MKSSTVRVTRTYKTEITEYVDVPVVQDDGAPGYPSVEKIAETLIEAKIAAGHDIDWTEVSDKPETYPKPIIDGEILPTPETQEKSDV